MISNTLKAEKVEQIIKLSADPNNKEESLKLLRDLLMKDTNGGKLYKYRNFDKNGHNIAIIENQTMHCSGPNAFNDPFDCKIGIDLESITDAICGAELKSIQTLFEHYIIPEKEVPEFKRLLIAYYEDKDSGEIMDFMKGKCIKTF